MAGVGDSTRKPSTCESFGNTGLWAQTTEYVCVSSRTRLSYTVCNYRSDRTPRQVQARLCVLCEPFVIFAVMLFCVRD